MYYINVYLVYFWIKMHDLDPCQINLARHNRACAYNAYNAMWLAIGYGLQHHQCQSKLLLTLVNRAMCRYWAFQGQILSHSHFMRCISEEINIMGYITNRKSHMGIPATLLCVALSVLRRSCSKSTQIPSPCVSERGRARAFIAAE